MSQNYNIISQYVKVVRRKYYLVGILCVILLATSIYSLFSGNYSIPVMKIFSVFFGNSDHVSKVVILNIRLPRVIAAIVCGWALSIAGLAIQSLLKNPLGSPSTLGITHGSAFGASLSIILFGSKILSTTFFAFLGAISATFIILSLAQVKKLSPEAIILCGVALSSLFASATILIQYLATDTELAEAVFWTFGDCSRSNWREIGILMVSTLLVTVYFFYISWDLNVLSSGDEIAKGLGVSVRRIRMWGMILAAFISALATAYHGIIAFVGLIAPHISKRLVGEHYSILIPVSAVLGGAILLAADTLSRVIIGTGSLPVGIITSFLGAPMFLYLLIKGYKR